MRSIYIPNFRIFIKGFRFRRFSSIFVNFGCFLVKKRPKKAEIQIKFYCSIFFCWEASTYQISENFIKRFRFCKFSSFLVNFGCFLVNKRQKKRPISKKSFFVAFCFVEKHLHTKFQKISSNGLDFANFLHFWSILAVFWLKNGQKGQNKKKDFL